MLMTLDIVESHKALLDEAAARFKASPDAHHGVQYLAALDVLGHSLNHLCRTMSVVRERPFLQVEKPR